MANTVEQLESQLADLRIRLYYMKKNPKIQREFKRTIRQKTQQLRQAIRNRDEFNLWVDTGEES